MFNSRDCRRVLVLALCVVVLAALPGSVSALKPAPQPGAPVKVVTKPLEPFVIKNPDGSLSGFSIDLWNELARRLDLPYEWIEVTKVTEQIDAVRNGQADAAIAGISMTRAREDVIDFSHPIFNSGLQVLVSEQGNSSSLGTLILAYAPHVLRILGLALLIAFITANIIWLIERRTDPDFPKGYIAGIWEGLWMFFGVVSSASYSEKPAEGLRRLLVMVWWIFGVILIAQFTATVTSALTVQQLQGSISGPDDLPGKRVAAVTGTTSAAYLTDRAIGFTGVQTIREAYDLLESNQVDAVVYDAPVLVYYASNAGRGKVRVVGSIFREEPYGIALPTGSTMREGINAALLDIRQDGTYDEIYSKWFRPRE